MARVLTTDDAKKFGLPGRQVMELVSGSLGSDAITLRIVDIPVAATGDSPRSPHYHQGFEECIYVLDGAGATHSDSGVHALKAGDAILIPPGEKHVTRNTGSVPLRLLCFFPVNDITRGTRE
jgi:mannose-6-phosphate isomerase-like protein (cupin superfamily)